MKKNELIKFYNRKLKEFKKHNELYYEKSRPAINDAEYDKAIKIIKETSQGRRDRLRRMKNFHRDVFPPV